MSLIIHSDSAKLSGSDEAPIFCDLKRPQTFDSYTICVSKTFTKEIVLFPKGFENVQDPGIAKGELTRRCKAPYPTNANLIRQCFTAFITANGISHLDPRQHSHMDGGVLASGVCAELANFIELTSDKTTTIKTGPHLSQKSRGIAVTLLLPATAAGKQNLNKSQIALLNAFAQIAQTPETKSTNSAGFDVGVPKAWPSCEEPPRCTQTVRLSVVAGKDDVASYMKRMQVKTPNKDLSWASKNAVCVSYTDSKKANSSYVALDTKHEPTVADAANAIMQALTTVQLQSSSVLTLPPGLIAPDLVNLEEPEINDNGPFLEFQAELQRKFKEIHLCKPFVEIPKAVLSSLITEGCIQRFVRVCSNSQPWNEQDNRHNVGILYSSDEEMLQFYLKRCRADVPRVWPMTDWPPYILLPPEGEEVAANISILWFKPESVHIGGDLNLFGPCVRTSVNVCEFNNSHTGRVIPNVASVERLRNAGYFVVPCTAQSVLPSYAPRTDVLWNSFRDFLFETERQLIDPMSCDTSTIVEPNLRAPEPPNCRDGSDHSGNDKFYSSILSSHFGHPCATIGRAYQVIQEHATNKSTEGKAFHGLVSAGMLKFGTSFSMEELMNVCTELVSNGQQQGNTELVVRSESPNKRHRTPPVPDDVPADLPTITASLGETQTPIDIPDPLIEHLKESIGRKYILALSGMKDVSFPDGSKLAEYELPIDDYDVLETCWVGLGHAAIELPNEDTMMILKNTTDKFLKSTFLVDITDPVDKRNSVSWHFAAVQACLEHKPRQDGCVKKLNETFIIVSNEDNSKNEIHRFLCNSDGVSNGTSRKCTVADILSNETKKTHKRNIFWIKYSANGEDMAVACYSG